MNAPHTLAIRQEYSKTHHAGRCSCGWRACFKSKRRIEKLHATHVQMKAHKEARS